MKTERQLIAVSEFAKAAGISPQAVYKRLNNQLKEYVEIVDNRKMIDKKALIEVYGIEENDGVDNKVDNKSDYVTTHIKPEDNPEIIELLKEQLDQNRQQLDILKNELDIKNTQIQELNSRLSESQKLLDQQQKLNAIAENKLLQLEEELKQEDPPEEQKKPHGLFGKFFSK